MSEETLVAEQISTNEATAETKEETSLLDEAIKSESETSEVKDEKKVEAIKEETPIEYEDFKLPEGIVIDDEYKNEFKSIAKELKLNQDQAQKLVDLQTKFTSDYSTKVNEHFKLQVDTWKQESIAELGANYKDELKVVAKAMNSFGSPELRTLLNETGLGNHKEVVKFFLNIGKKVSEDKIIDSNIGKERTAKSLAEKHYPNTKL
jgi:hypothetical protein